MYFKLNQYCDTSYYIYSILLECFRLSIFIILILILHNFFFFLVSYEISPNSNTWNCQFLNFLITGNVFTNTLEA